MTAGDLRIVPANAASWDDLQAVFAEAGFSKVSHPTLRRVVMRIDF
jgi:hypothetical protein